MQDDEPTRRQDGLDVGPDDAHNKLETAALKVAQFDYMGRLASVAQRRSIFYIGILIISLVVGISSVFTVRGAEHYAGMLGMLTLGWVLPSSVVVYVLWEVSIKRPSEIMDFTLGILLMAIFCVFMQWGFYKLGSLVALRDINNASVLCEASRDQVLTGDTHTMSIGNRYLEPVLPDGTPIELGHVQPPQIIHLQYRVLDKNNKSSVNVGTIKDVFLCRFYDPRVWTVEADNIYSYNYNTMVWKLGE